MSLYDVAVIGSGVFGSWTACCLARMGQKVVVMDAHGPGNSRSSSGGESRIIRMGYGRDELYTRWAVRSLPLWQALPRDPGPPLFHGTGVLWLARDADPLTLETLATLRALGVAHETLSRADLEARYPQIGLGSSSWGILEPGSGVLMARRAVQAVLAEAMRAGAAYLQEASALPEGTGRLESVATRGGQVRAETFVFACGPWLPALFPKLLGGRIVPTRQEVFFFGTPPADRRFAPSALPAWIDFGEEVYGVPDLEHRGLKIALDRRGPPFDPEAGDRAVSEEAIANMRVLLGRRFPDLAGAPLLEARVCQYENTSSGDFLVDRHPELQNVWLVGGGSGHGFKHGPALGEYVAGRVLEGGPVEPRFSLATKGTAPFTSLRVSMASPDEV